MCKECGEIMERRKHSYLSPELLDKPYYFTEWDYCKKCGYVQHYERYKIKNGI